MYKEHPSQAGRIMPTAKGFSITDLQIKKLAELKEKIKLTENQVKERDELELKLERSKLPSPLADGAKTRVKEVFLKDLYGMARNAWSKQMDKGNECEDESIKLVAKVSGIFGIKKNEQKFENDYFIGTPDIITDDAIIDIKTSWDGLTFPWFDEEMPDKDYIFQVLAYMHLTGRRKGYVAFCLTNSNEDAIQDECRREAWRRKVIDPTADVLQEIEDDVRAQMEFDQVPDVLRVRMFEVKYDEDTIKKMIERVECCRTYYAELTKKIENKKDVYENL